MTCRHKPGDRDCTSRYADPLERSYASLSSTSTTPDADRFVVDDVEQIGDHLVMKVRYPNCASCAYEGVKVMVFFDATLKQAIKWRRIDPHFRAKSANIDTHAPSPAARFPASADGWSDAIAYARSKTR